uniref:Ribosome biogenesis protein NOP53 n=2 Tax=Meloidogyne TaxID=189290 RepID=A0A6V7XAV2_MELEN|nr:unnamed protein product [Meloidogyne enterolobii]CAD2196388.1 unnamed protein product [Meloidogyne enterolobii]
MEKQKGNSRLYDLWECEDNNLQNKRIKSTRYIPSILPPVTLPDEGISYNPPLGSYLDFLGKVVKEEEKIFAEEERVEKKIRPNDDEFFNFGGLKEDLKFTIEGPLSIGEVKTEVEEPVENEEIKIEEKDNEKLRTRLRLKKKKNLKQIQNSTTKVVDNQKKIQKQQLQSLKSLTKNVNSEHAQHLNKIKLKNKQWKIKNLTTRKKLGRGKFEPYEEPVITPKELPASLRCLTSASNSLIQERVKSLQQRNILSIGGANKTTNIKNKLKIKFVEKRSVKSITEDSEII